MTMKKKDHPRYLTWKGMRRRCLSPNHTSFHHYGGRGIKICDRWSDFWTFAEDVGPKPSPRHTLDRKDNDGDYEPGNCRWATKSEQMKNCRHVAIIGWRKGKPLSAEHRAKISEATRGKPKRREAEGRLP